MENNETMNSCFMLAINLDTPVDLGSIFDSKDYKDTGLELDSHITLFYAQGKEIPRANLMLDVKSILGDDYDNFMDLFLRDADRKVFDYFELSKFENESDYVVLKLKKDNEIYNWLKKLNNGLSKKYGIISLFKEYTPHISLAELLPGTADKYLNSEQLLAILKDSYIDFDDFMISYGLSNEVKDRKVYYLTQFNCIDRYFKLKRLEEFNNNLI